MALREEKYILLTTFRRGGTPVATPVWAAGLAGEEVAFWTSSGSGKAKRLAHTTRVKVQPCNVRGRVKPGSQPIEAAARLVSGGELDVIRARILAKYGIATKLARWMGTLVGTLRGKRIPYGDRGVIITPVASGG